MVNSQVNEFAGAPVNQQSFSRQLVYAISGIVALCLTKVLERETHSELSRDLLNLAWEVNCAWDAVVAGDIGDLKEHVKSESEVRFR